MKKLLFLIAATLCFVGTADAQKIKKSKKHRTKIEVQVPTQEATKTEQAQPTAVQSAAQNSPQVEAEPTVKADSTATTAQPQPQEPKSEEAAKVEAKKVEPHLHVPQIALNDSLRKESIRPTKPINVDAILDTLPTADKNLSVILFNDNTWRYVSTGNTKADETVFSKYWSETYLFPYCNVPLSSIPETTPIQLVDADRAYHYPYKGYITSRYGPRNGRRHAGMDIALRTGDTIRAVFNGKVRYSRFHENGYGELVVVRHDNGLETYNAHLSKRLVKSGDRVVAGQPIGLGGSTGRSSGPHLHFEFRYMGQAFDPERIIDFKTGNLRRDFILLKRSYFDTTSRYEQDWNSEKTPEPAKPATTVTKTTTTKTTTTTVKPKAKPKPQPVYHTVASGEYLGGIAIRYKTTVDAICRLNNIDNPDKVRSGQKIRVK